MGSIHNDIVIVIVYVSMTVFSSALQLDQRINDTVSSNQTSCPTWIPSGHPSKSNNLCPPLYYLSCTENHIYLTYGMCATYSEVTDLLSTVHCPFFRALDYNVTVPGFISLPNKINELNHYMCAPLKRKGNLCSECVNGFAPSFNSFKDECSNCEAISCYGIPLYLILEFVPATLFYLIILTFQLNITLAPMTCFVMYSQMVLLIFGIKFEDPSVRVLIFDGDSNYPTAFMKIVFTGYGIWNLDFFRYVVPPFCVSSRLKSIHIAFLGYTSAFYPLFLITLTWICIELHDHNFRPLALLCRWFRVCCVRLQRGCNSKGDIISVFASFFLLSYAKFLYQLVALVMCKHVAYRSYNHTLHDSYISFTDLRVSCGSLEYLAFAIPALLITFVFNILPTLLILFYPMTRFRSLLSKCKLDFHALKFFIERFQGCYRDNSLGEGGNDMRSFSVLYFFLQLFVLAGILFVKPLTSQQLIWFPTGTLVLLSALLIAFCKPYKKVYMNVLDTLLLAHFGLLCYFMSISCYFGKEYIIPVIKVAFLLPLAILILWLILQLIISVVGAAVQPLMIKSVCSYLKQNNKHNIGASEKDRKSCEPLISPTTTTIDFSSYGATDCS